MSTLRGDQSGCFNPQQHLQICKDCRRNIKDTRVRDSHRLWSDFKVEIQDTLERPHLPDVVCLGYWEK